MYSTGTKTAVVIFALLIGFLIFQQFRIHDLNDMSATQNEDKYSYLDHQSDKYKSYENAGFVSYKKENMESNHPQITNINNVNKTLTHRVTNLQSQRDVLKEQISTLKRENELLLKQDKEKEVMLKKIEAENIALKAEINTLKKTIAKPTNADVKENLNHEAMIGFLLGDLSTETFRVKGIKQGL